MSTVLTHRRRRRRRIRRRRRTRLIKDSKKTKLTKNFKGQELVASHDHPRPEGRRHMEEEEEECLNSWQNNDY